MNVVSCFGNFHSSGTEDDFGNSSGGCCVELWYRGEAAEISFQEYRQRLASVGLTGKNSAALSLLFAEGV